MSSRSSLWSRVALCFLILTFLSSSFAPALAATYAVTNADVSAEQTSGGYGGSSSSTDANGNYVINSSIGVGNYSVTASSIGFIDGVDNVSVSSLSSVVTANFVLTRSAIIQGYVKGYDGKAVVGASVELDDNVTGNSIDSGTTDSNGFYYFATSIPTGTYTVSVSFNFPFEYTAELLMLGESYSTYPVPFYQDTPYLSQGYLDGASAPISATVGQVTTASTIVLAQSGVITGVLTDPNGRPLPNAAVDAEGENGGSLTVLTDSTGTYRISYGVSSDTYTLTGYSPGMIGTPDTVSAAPGSTATANLASSAAATISGSVLRSSDSKPIPGAEVSVFSKDYTYYGYATTGADGSYKITGALGADQYSLEVTLGGQPLNQTTSPITLAAGQNLVYNVKANAYFITGTVYANSTGGPTLQDADVTLSFGGYTAPPGGSTFTAKDGTYQLVVPVETGTMGMMMTGGNLTATYSGYNKASFNQSVTIGTDLTNVNFVLTKAGAAKSATISGSVTGNSGPNLPFSNTWYLINDTNNFYQIGLNTSSTAPYIFSSIATKAIEVYAEGPEGTSGQMSIWIPKAIFQGPFTVTSTPGPNPTVTSTGGNSTYTEITITYSHSYRFITFTSTTAIPEFPGFMLLAALGSSVAVGLLAERRLRSPAYLRA